jgi:plasmid stability protein
MGQVLVRNLDDGVIQALKERAEARGHSLEQELREILTKASRYDTEEALAVVDRIAAMTPKGVKQTDSVTILREERDRRGRW